MSDGLFAGNHPKSGFYYADKGPMLAPHIQPVKESTAGGDSRHQAATKSPAWNSTILVNTGLTSAETSYNSDLPNH